MRRSIGRVIAGLAEADPERIVAIADEGMLTAGGLHTESESLARAYRDLGVRRDDLVTVSLRNSLDMVTVCAAIWKAGATPQPVSPALADDELAELVALARPALVVGDRALDGVECRPGSWRPASWRPGTAPAEPLADLWSSSWKAPASSGSTGRPKVVVAAGPALVDPTRPVAPFLPLSAVQLVVGPMTHSATFTYAFRGLMTGHRLVILPRFDERRVLAAIAEHGVTWALLVPTMIHRLLRLPEQERAAADVRSLETVLHLGSPCPPADKRALIDWLGAERVVEVYAGSESNGLTMIRGDEWLQRRGSVGRPIGGTEVRIRRADGTMAPPGETGAVWMRRGESPAYRYVGGRSRRDDDGWDTLGDLGSIDADGYLTIADRADDLILRGGVNVYPAEIERVLETHPGVRGAVAYGVPDDDLGRRIEVTVDVADSVVGADELRQWTDARLGVERRIARVTVVHHPLRDDAGKVRRSALADAAASLTPASRR